MDLHDLGYFAPLFDAVMGYSLGMKFATCFWFVRLMKNRLNSKNDSKLLVGKNFLSLLIGIWA